MKKERHMSTETKLQPHPLFKVKLKEELFGGKGEVKVWNLLAQRLMGGFKACLWCELEAGGAVGKHYQESYDELIICISGAGTATINGECFAFESGIPVFLKMGQTLELRAGSKQALVYLIVKIEPQA